MKVCIGSLLVVVVAGALSGSASAAHVADGQVIRVRARCQSRATPMVEVPQRARDMAGSSDLVGSGTLWTRREAGIVPPAQWQAARLTDGRWRLKFPWFRLRAGRLEITAKRVGGGGRFSAETHQDSYLPTGFLPSALLFSSTGCWRVTGALGGSTVTVRIAIPRTPTA